MPQSLQEGFLYGFDASQISLALFGATMQDAFFDALNNSNGSLYYIAMVCGLVGMTMLVFGIKKIGVVGALAWSAIMIHIFVHPTYNDSDSLFFTNLKKDPILQKVVPYGGQFTQAENDALLSLCTTCGEVTDSSKKYQDILGNWVTSFHADQGQESGSRNAPGVHVMSMHLYLIHYLNLLNFFVNDELVPYGRRMASANQNFIEAIKMARFAGPQAPYHAAEFAVACAGSSVAQDVAFLMFDDAETRAPGSVEAMQNYNLRAEDAVNLYEMFAAHKMTQGVKLGDDATDAEKMSVQMPMLVKEVKCNRSFLGGIANFFTNQEDGCGKAQKALKSIMYGGADSWKNHVSHQKVSENLKDIRAAQIELSAEDKLAFQKVEVVMVVPLGLGDVARQVIGSAQASEADRMAGEMIGWLHSKIPGQSFNLNLSNKIREKFGMAPLDVSFESAQAIKSLRRSAVKGVTGRDASQGFNVMDKNLSDTFRGTRTERIDLSALYSGLSKEEKVVEVSNCLQMFGVKSARQRISALIQTQVVNDAARALRVARDAPTDLNAHQDSDVVSLAMSQALVRATTSCKEGGLIRRAVQVQAGLGNATGLFPTPGADIARRAADVASGYHDANCIVQAGEIADRTTAAMASNDWARVQAIMTVAEDPNYIGGLRQDIAKVGSFVAPIAIWFKGLVGGFTSGTYAEIMPAIVSLGMAVALMFAPLIMMLGLLLPQYSLNAMLLPIMLIGYLGMVRIIFSLIHMFAGIMQGGADNNSYQLDGQTISMVDIALGNAYGAAFILTGALLVMLKNPGAIVQKFAGSADKASSISFQEAMAMGGALAVAKKAAMGVAAVATGGKALAVKAVAAKAIGGGSVMKGAGMMMGASMKADTMDTINSSLGNMEKAAEYDALGGTYEASDTLYRTKTSAGRVAGKKKKVSLDPKKLAFEEKDFAQKELDEELKVQGLSSWTREISYDEKNPDGSIGKKKSDSASEMIADEVAALLMKEDAKLPAQERKYSNQQGGEVAAKAAARAIVKQAVADPKNGYNRQNAPKIMTDQGPDERVAKVIAHQIAAKSMGKKVGNNSGDVPKPRIKADKPFPGN